MGHHNFPTDPFTILEPLHQEIKKQIVAQERRLNHKIVKGSAGLYTRALVECTLRTKKSTLLAWLCPSFKIQLLVQQVQSRHVIKCIQIKVTFSSSNNNYLLMLLELRQPPFSNLITLNRENTGTNYTIFKRKC